MAIRPLATVLAASMVCLIAIPAFGDADAEFHECDDLKHESPDRAIESCTRALTSGELSKLLVYLAYRARGVAHKSKGNLREALADFDASIETRRRHNLTNRSPIQPPLQIVGSSKNF